MPAARSNQTVTGTAWPQGLPRSLPDEALLLVFRAELELRPSGTAENSRKERE